ncbi:hypothetical protein CEXT_119851 [Caerostris extrusa]|uniref:Uncharacterized protein n=1 Tax=Caerostris extrusa TaxID=172846 RepID=A0AAV4U516_CAEEX|nr:hypothetical protein CEXT_119851 [Caerostris extrusa]
MLHSDGRPPNSWLPKPRIGKKKKKKRKKLEVVRAKISEKIISLLPQVDNPNLGWEKQDSRMSSVGKANRGHRSTGRGFHQQLSGGVWTQNSLFSHSNTPSLAHNTPDHKCGTFCNSLSVRRGT